MNGSPHEPSRTTNDASFKVLLMTGFRRSRRSSDKRKHGMLTCRIVVDPPMRSKNDKSSPRRPLTRTRIRSWRGDNLSGDLMPLQGVSSNQAPRRAHLSDVRVGARSLSPSSAHPLTTERLWTAHNLAGAFAAERRMAIRWSSVSDDPLGACWHWWLAKNQREPVARSAR